MNVRDFDFELPEELIAQAPPPERSASRLLHVPPSGPPVHRAFRDLPRLLHAGDLLVLNETRVIPARLALTRASGGRVEALLVRRDGTAWRALVRPAKRLRPGESLAGGGGEYSARIVELSGGEARIELGGLPEEEILERHGAVPLPPYVRREAAPEDRVRYQTVFARVAGAVAAPTAGLHFDEPLLAALAEREVGTAFLVLHVGPGTFRPLPESGDLESVRLDAERFSIPESTVRAIRAARASGRRVVAVGTTVVRALETWARRNGLDAVDVPDALGGETDLFVRPPFEFRVVDALVTNFHLPRSSLLCLVAAFAGRERILAAYREAVLERYRFYSYGDATFLERAPSPERSSGSPGGAP